MTNSELLVEIASKYIGLKESDNLVSKIRRTVHQDPNKEPWCIDFIWFCLDQIKQKSDLMRTNSAMALWTHSDTRLRTLRPEIGNIVIWCFGGTSRGHGGIVAEIHEGLGLIKTIEGNTTPANTVDRIGDGVYLKTRHIISPPGAMQLQGFLRPWRLASLPMNQG
jgi:hypothetical protein